MTSRQTDRITQYKSRASVDDELVPPRIPLWDFKKEYRTGDGEIETLADRPGADDHAHCPSWGSLT